MMRAITRGIVAGTAIGAALVGAGAMWRYVRTTGKKTPSSITAHRVWGS
ncbi:hypothetical protein Rhow_007973 [Rhodococcus wratislaviensis]|uniref:Uncharacterized protein n=1 Tax=Rhodococcus wratislaviensis TaxID=44752 RepID=A0A402C1B7_RHOWR|nr:hypothetical protein Rhow_007973 [Rhodococcus wratislaviensis]